MKHCPHCKQTLPLSEFGRSSRGALKLQSWCKPCRYANNKEWHRSRRGATDGRKFRYWRPPFEKRSSRAKQTDAQCAEIRQRWSESSPKLAAEFGVTPARIRQIWHGDLA